jgi:hypothetical protein
MVQVKKEFLGKGSVVCINKPEWAIANISTVIKLDCASQDELARLLEIGHPSVEDIGAEKKK